MIMSFYDQCLVEFVGWEDINKFFKKKRKRNFVILKLWMFIGFYKIIVEFILK